MTDAADGGAVSGGTDGGAVSGGTDGGAGPLGSVLLYGFGVTNTAVAAALVARAVPVVAVDDRVDPERATVADRLGVTLIDGSSIDDAALAGLLAAADALVPAPGLPERHRVFELARAAGVPVRSEFDLAAAWDRRPLLSITGTNGKTTVTMLVTAMLEASGRRAAAVGNTDLPLIAAIDDPDWDVFVVESSSFRLAHTHHFEPLAAAWLNFAPDHLDVHVSLAAYEAAKARSWADLGPGSVAVANAEDPVVVRHVGEGRGRFVTFGVDPASAIGSIPHYTCRDGVLVTPEGEAVIPAADMFRALPHDISNALAATALALAGGATVDGVRAALGSFEGLAHRVELVGSADGVAWYDDSKATAPHAVIAAASGFASVVLVAGGRNKGLDLGELAPLTGRLRAVVGIGEAGPDVLAALPGVPGVAVGSMEAAVDAAAGFARPGDVVLLSPGCASFDWYGGYAARGDHFARLVRRRLAAAGAEPSDDEPARSGGGGSQ